MKSFFPPPAPILQPQTPFLAQQPNMYAPGLPGMMVSPMQPQMMQQAQPGFHQIPGASPQLSFPQPQMMQQMPQFPQQPFQSLASGISNPPVIVQQSPYPPPPPPVVVSHPAPTKERYAWAQRTEKMKWGVAESIDVDQIVRRGDLNSVLFYMDQFINSTITKDDLPQFGSKGALNAFLILQLGADYLMTQKTRLETEIAQQKPNNEQANNTLIQQYNYNIELASKNIQQRDEQIAVLKRQVAQLHEERKQHKVLLQKYHKKFAQMKGKKPPKSSKNIIESDDEPGALHDETALQELKIIDQNMNNGPSSKQSKQKQQQKKNLIDDSSISDSISEGEINTAAIRNNMDSIQEEEEEGYTDGEINDEYEEEEEFDISNSQHSGEEDAEDEY